MKQLIKILGLSLFLFTLTNCNNKSSNDQAVTYRWQNGLCYSSLNRQVDNTNCNGLINSNTNTNYYYAANGQCIDRTTNYPVQTTLCQTTTGIGGSQQCIGQYYYYHPTYLQYVPVNCGTTNGWANGQQTYICAGQSLYTTAGQQITCM